MRTHTFLTESLGTPYLEKKLFNILGIFDPLKVLTHEMDIYNLCYTL